MILLVAGVMDLRATAVLTAAIAVERLSPWPRQAARVFGLLAIAAGVVMAGRVLV